MSGGSYEYLYTKDADDLVNSHHAELQRMIDRLIGLGYDDVADELIQLQLSIRSYRLRAEAILRRTSGVMKAVEWVDSADWSLPRIQEAVDEYRSAPPYRRV